MCFDVQTIKKKFTNDSKRQLNTRNMVYLRACQVAITTKMSTRVDKLKGCCNICIQQDLVAVIFFYNWVSLSWSSVGMENEKLFQMLT